MTVKYSTAYGSWLYHCLFGCLEAGFDDKEAATAAFVSHKC